MTCATFLMDGFDMEVENPETHLQDVQDSIAVFDFPAHERLAVVEYLKFQPLYKDFASVVASILGECLKKRFIEIASVQHRAKEVSSFGRKAATPSPSDPNAPKYSNPLKQITDLAGVRVITYFPGTLANIDDLIFNEFVVTERSDKGTELIQRERFGYQSIHFLVQMKPERARLAEYERFANVIAEVQIRTVLQHAWAEIEHDIQYKSSTSIPSDIRRRFMALAGMLEIADREFQAIQSADKALENQSRDMVERGELRGVEITPSALRLFLDKKLGQDERISDWRYDWTTRLLKQQGFKDLEQVEEAIAPFNDDQLSRIASGGRQGQTTRFELMLLAALGSKFLERHPYKEHDWFQESSGLSLKKFKDAGVHVSEFDPQTR